MVKLINRLVVYFMMFIINFKYAMKVAYNTQINKFDVHHLYAKGVLIDKIFGRPSAFIENKDSGVPDYITKNNIPLWYVSLTISEFSNAASVIPIITQIGLMSPLVTSVVNTQTNELIGFDVIMPDVFEGCSKKMYDFVIGHEIGHIELDHFKHIRKGLSRKISREFEADKFGMEYAGVTDPAEKQMLIKNMYRHVLKITCEYIGYDLQDNVIEFILNNWSIVQKRLQKVIS